MQVMAREIFNLALALFVNVLEGGTTFQPNPNSMVQNGSKSICDCMPSCPHQAHKDPCTGKDPVYFGECLSTCLILPDAY